MVEIKKAGLIDQFNLVMRNVFLILIVVIGLLSCNEKANSIYRKLSMNNVFASEFNNIYEYEVRHKSEVWSFYLSERNDTLFILKEYQTIDCKLIIPIVEFVHNTSIIDLNSNCPLLQLSAIMSAEIDSVEYANANTIWKIKLELNEKDIEIGQHCDVSVRYLFYSRSNGIIKVETNDIDLERGYWPF